jgi:hypothetical protein
MMPGAAVTQDATGERADWFQISTLLGRKVGSSGSVLDAK